MHNERITTRFKLHKRGRKPFRSANLKKKKSKSFTETELKNTGISTQGETRRPPHSSDMQFPVSVQRTNNNGTR